MCRLERIEICWVQISHPLGAAALRLLVGAQAMWCVVPCELLCAVAVCTLSAERGLVAKLCASCAELALLRFMRPLRFMRSAHARPGDSRTAHAHAHGVAVNRSSANCAAQHGCGAVVSAFMVSERTTRVGRG